jgi:hypothetical protein
MGKDSTFPKSDQAAFDPDIVLSDALEENTQSETQCDG